MTPIDTPQLRALVSAKAINELVVIGTSDGYKVVVNGKMQLYTQRNEPKLFASADSAIRALKELGFARIAFDVRKI